MARKRGVGRPRAVIDKELFENLARIQCTRDEICSVLGVVDKTLARWCKDTYGVTTEDVLRGFRGCGRASLRRAQYRRALDGSDTMLVWLGKNWLKQTDKLEVDPGEATSEALQSLLALEQRAAK